MMSGWQLINGASVIAVMAVLSLSNHDMIPSWANFGLSAVCGFVWSHSWRMGHK